MTLHPKPVLAATLVLALGLTVGCASGSIPEPADGSAAPSTTEARLSPAELQTRSGLELGPNKPLTRIAVGSCNRTTLPQPIWDPVLDANPQLWVWLGDNVYGDTEDMSVLRSKYETQLDMSSYRTVLATAEVIGTWDDHDYGRNNAGREYLQRNASQQEALDFLGVPYDDPRRDRAGLYSSHAWGPEGRRVKVILLDTRYHRDERGSDGTILGEQQWRWLEDELTGSDAQIHLIGNGIQFLPEDHRFEKWANFPSERRRLIDLIGASGATGVVLLSGDRHLSEISRIDDEGVPYPLYELTSSGMTHSYEGGGDEVNRHRVGENFTGLSFGFLEIDWEAGQISLQARDVDGRAVRSTTLDFEALGIRRR